MKISRREFVRQMVALGLSSAAAGVIFQSLSCDSADIITSPSVPPSEVPGTAAPVITPSPRPSQVPAETTSPVVSPAPLPFGTYLAVARGEDPVEIVNAAVKALGGIERFVKKGDNVIIKPNICVAYHSYEYAATTNPEVVAALVKLCLGAGAGKVRVMDYPFGGTPEQAYSRSGIGEAVKAAGGEMEIMSKIKFRETSIPGGLDISSWPVMPWMPMCSSTYL